MKKSHILLSLSLFAIGNLFAQNSLLKNPVTKAPFTTGSIDNIEMISNGKDVALVAFNGGTEAFYIIDVQDNIASDATKNEVSTIADFEGVLSGASGQTEIWMQDIQVNPISKSIYVLANSATASYIIKVEENGAKAEVLNLAKLPHCKVSWGGSDKINVQDMTSGNGTLYITSGSNFTLDGEIAWAAAPFTHESSTTNRATSMFKTNWGGKYYTNAPLEKLDFGTIKGEDRLMGVTLCAPGFSIKTSDLEGAGVLEVTEDFNIRFSPPTKVIHQTNGWDHALFNLHSRNTLMRIGKEYIDGSPVAGDKYNANTQHLRTTSGAPTPGLSDDQIKVYTEPFQMIAKWSDRKLLVLKNNELSLMTTFEGEVGIDENGAESPMSFFPNPASGLVTFNFSDQTEATRLSLIGIDGKEVLTQRVSGQTLALDLSIYPVGTYVVQLTNDQHQMIYSEKITLTK